MQFLAILNEKMIISKYENLFKTNLKPTVFKKNNKKNYDRFVYKSPNSSKSNVLFGAKGLLTAIKSLLI